jgi:hypothetical protein
VHAPLGIGKKGIFSLEKFASKIPCQPLAWVDRVAEVVTSRAADFSWTGAMLGSTASILIL